MQRTLISLSVLGLLTSVAAAQPDPSAPPPGPPAPAEPPVPPMPPTPPVAPMKPPVPIDADLKPAEPMPAEKPPEPGPEKIPVGKAGQGWITPGILMQGWLLTDRAGGKTTTSTFRLRRAEVSVKGEILPKRVGFQVMFDPAKVREPVNTTLTDSGGSTVVVKTLPASLSVLQDFYITALNKNIDVSIGQFKIPVSWEGYNSSAKLMLPERALVSTTFGDKRDLGIRLAKTFKKWSYSAGVFNGQGANNLDTNVQKDVALRVEAYPVEGLTIAAVAYDSIGIRNRAGTKDRWEADVRYDHGPYLVQAEYIRARDKAKDNVAFVTAQGFYALAGYTIKDKRLCGDLQPIVRVSYFDPDTSKDLDPTMGGLDEEMTYAVGANYYLKGHEMKLQGVFERQQFQTKTPNINEVILAAQVWY